MIRLILLITTICFCDELNAQNKEGLIHSSFESIDLANTNECISAQKSEEISEIIQSNIKQLKKEGKLPEINKNAMVSFDWPLQKNPNLDFTGYYAVSNFVDQDDTGGIEDYYCGDRTYNGHNGTDYFLFPFSWYLYENDFVEIIAAEDGIIVAKMDGEEDDHCACYGTWNAVFVQHTDGSVAWYGHMKEASLTTKKIGDAVVTGEYLGLVASSGCSTGPHLHFEIRDENNNVVDPYAGACNSGVASWWDAQQNYRVPTLNALLTHHSPPVFGCTDDEQTNFSNKFYVGNTVYIGTFYRDIEIGHVTNYTIKRPDNSIWQSWSHSSTSGGNAINWLWGWDLPSNGPFGTWTVEAEFLGQTLTHNFEYNVCLPNLIVTAPDILPNSAEAETYIEINGGNALPSSNTSNLKANELNVKGSGVEVEQGAQLDFSNEPCSP